ncbi:MAG: hypothetical protein IJR99_14330 [Kiritimatiellae bacterium]|nr:hypothetical protein [Kiritimatiellia bacterium]
MSKKTIRSDLADVPFYDYLWQFYSQNRKMIHSVYTPLWHWAIVTPGF